MAISDNWTEEHRKLTVRMIFVTNLQRKPDFPIPNQQKKNL